MTELAVAGPPLIRTKLLPPVARDTIERPEAVATLLADGLRRLSLIRAPAGWGKSSLAAAWAAADPRPFAWVALDRQDSAPDRFFAYATAALRTLVPAAGERSMDILLAGGRLIDEVLPALLEELGGLAEPGVLVLDDYHLIDNPDVHAAVAFMLEHAPPTLELALLSRTAPPLPLARLRGRGQLAEVSVDELRFSAAEAGELLNERQGLGLEREDLDRLVGRTEGWPAGLYLAGLSLRGRDDRAAAVARFAGDDRHVVDYLTEEVLTGQPPDIRDFLLDTCILERLCAPLCDAVTGREDAATLLRRIEASNLFLVPLDNQREWYRYHHLFADLLRLELRGRDTAELHRRAAAWHLDHGLLSEAVNHHVAAGDIAAAGEAIAANWVAAMSTGGHHAAVRWLDALPEEAVRTDARLGLARGMTYISVGRVEDVDPWIDAVAGVTNAGPSYDGFSSPQAASDYLRGVQRWLVGDLSGCLVASQAALAHAGPFNLWGASLSGLSRLLLGDIEGAREELAEALANALELDLHIPEISCLASLAEIHRLDGDFEAAHKLAERALDMTERYGMREYWVGGAAHTALGEILLADGRRDEALAELERGLELSRRGAGAPIVALALISLATAHPPETARSLLAEARGILTSCPDPGRLPMRRLEEAERRAGASRRRAVVLGESFSDRELDVLRMLTGSLSLREIGGELFISLNTVKSHTKAIYRKLGAADRSDAVARARELGLI